MEKWLEFEINCTKYLNHTFGHKAHFVHLGGGDSTVPDIEVETLTGRKFYIDVKCGNAQCGQFVLRADATKKCFVFSSKNKTKINSHVKKIINHMDADFESYIAAGRAGKEIDLGEDETFVRWIMETYLQKGAKFFITDNFTILSITDFPKHFSVTAIYRAKRSGSSKVGKTKTPQVLKYIQDNYQIKSHISEDGKLFIFSPLNLNNKRFKLDGYEYMFAERDGKYEIRKLSNTFNYNVIFKIQKKNKNGLTNQEFEQFLD